LIFYIATHQREVSQFEKVVHFSNWDPFQTVAKVCAGHLRANEKQVFSMALVQCNTQECFYLPGFMLAGVDEWVRGDLNM